MTPARDRPAARRRRERGGRTLRTLPFLCAMVALPTAALRAQLTVSQLEIVVTPSDSGRAMTNYVVKNPGPLAAQAFITREDWHRAENGDNVFVPTGTTRYSCGALLSVFPIAFRLEPGAEQIVRVAVERAPLKECWDIFFVAALPPPAPPSGGLRYSVRTGVKVYVAPAGLARAASIREMNFHTVAAYRATPASRFIAIDFSNDGEVHLEGRGRIEFRRLDNSVAAVAVIPPFPTLPGAIRRLAIDVPSSVGTGSYVVLALIDFDGAEIAAGQLELTVR
jgi:P pilus assembly chaperone PapD